MTTESQKKPDQTEALVMIDRLWSVIATGSLVLAQETDPDDGWWEALVVEVKGGECTLEWKDYPDLGKFKRSLTSLAIINPKKKP